MRLLPALLIAVTGMLAAQPAARAAEAPRLLVLPLEMTDTSGEAVDQATAHAIRLERVTEQLRDAIAGTGVYTVVDAAPVQTEIEKARATQHLQHCNGCERDLATLAGADRVLVGEVYKISTLVLGLRVEILDVSTGRRVFGRALDFRGDNDESWLRAAGYLVRDLAEAPPQSL